LATNVEHASVVSSLADKMSASSSDGEERGDVDTWSDFDGEGAEEEALVSAS
jgi:hypothetical protein